VGFRPSRSLWLLRSLFFKTFFFSSLVSATTEPFHDFFL
jgi:hypothetical protein